jgi:hypothetical protein
MSNRKKIGPIRMFNCWIPTLGLLFCGRLTGIMWKWPFHLLGITHRGNVIHFKSRKTKDRLYPFWFEGHLEVIRRGTLKRKFWKFRRSKFEHQSHIPYKPARLWNSEFGYP